MAVRKVGEEVEHLRAVPAESPPDLLEQYGLAAETPPERVVIKRVMPDREILAVMAGLGTVLAVRLMLLGAVASAFVLAHQALQGSPSGWGLMIVLAYTVTVIVPLVWLSTKRA